MTDKEKKTETPRTRSAGTAIANFFGFENLSSLAILFVLILAVRDSIISPYHVPTPSMEPTIKVGDRLLASKLAYGFKLPFIDYFPVVWSTPQKGDVIVFKYPLNPDIDYVKRVVGVAGDKIQVIDDILIVNGEPQNRQPHNDDRTILDDIEDNKDIKDLYRETLAGHGHWVMQNKSSHRPFLNTSWPPNGEVYVVPKDSVFVMGDNRDNSTDSRSWGEVPLAYIRGKALFVLWSLYSPPDSDWFRLRWDRFGFVLK